MSVEFTSEIECADCGAVCTIFSEEEITPIACPVCASDAITINIDEEE